MNTTEKKILAEKIRNFLANAPLNKEGGYTGAQLARNLNVPKKEIEEALLYDWRTFGHQEGHLNGWVNQRTGKGSLRNFLTGQYS